MFVRLTGLIVFVRHLFNSVCYSLVFIAFIIFDHEDTTNIDTNVRSVAGLQVVDIVGQGKGVNVGSAGGQGSWLRDQVAGYFALNKHIWKDVLKKI